MTANYDYNIRSEKVRRLGGGLFAGRVVGRERVRHGGGCMGPRLAAPPPLLTRTRVPLPSSPVSPSPLQWGGELHAHLSHAIFRFSEDQDVRLTAGVRAPLTQQVTDRGCPHAPPPAPAGPSRRASMRGALTASASPCRSPLTPADCPPPAPVAQGVGTAQPYLRVQENCWALTVHPDLQWRVSYDL